MCFGIHSCDSLLITAKVSTFGFWMGYLMPENNSVYYIANYKTITEPTYQLFLPNWTPLFIRQNQNFFYN